MTNKTEVIILENGYLSITITEIIDPQEDLDLSSTDITELPEDLYIGGDLNISYTNITELPKGLRVDGNLDLRGTDITEGPDDIYVGGKILR